MKFSELQLEPSLQSAIEQLGYTETTAIQAAAMPVILKGKDVAGLAQTGTGKTAAFLIPLMDRLLKGRIPQLMQKKTNTDHSQWGFAWHHGVCCVFRNHDWLSRFYYRSTGQ